MCILDYTGIKQLIENHKFENKYNYPEMDETTMEGYITDESKSVKWNKEQVVHNKNKVKLYRITYKNEETRIYEEFKNIIISYIINFYNYNLEQANYIFLQGWYEKHSEGYLAVLDYVQNLLNFTQKFLNLN